MQATLVEAGLETNPHNDAGSCLALYFDGVPTADEVNAAAQGQIGKHVIGVYEETAEYEVVSSKVSERAGLVRVLVYNIG